MKIWENKKNWEAVFKHLVNKRLEEKKKNASSNESLSLNFSNINVLGKVVMKNIWKVGKSVIGFSDSKSQETALPQLNEKDMYYFVLEEINFYMINLGLKNELTIDLIIELGLK